MKIVLVVALLAVPVLPGIVAADDLPWKDRYELAVTPWPGLSEDPNRYANAEVVWTNDAQIVGCNGFTCEIRVYPFDESEGFDLCPATSSFYAQPELGNECSGILVGEDLVLTAGHCLGNDPICDDKVILFDFAVASPTDPLGQPVLDPNGETRFIPVQNVYTCIGVESQSPFPPDTPPDEAFSTENAPAGPDWALMRLDRVVPEGRIPFPIERVAESAIGDPALILGHPKRMALKAELQALSAANGAPFHVLVGNSGSGVVNLYTGKVTWVATFGATALVVSEDPSCQEPNPIGYDLCFSCDGQASGQSTLGLVAIVPPIGLQVAPAPEVHHYGPPTTPEDFAWKQVTLSVPAPPPGEQPSRDVDWTFVQEGPIAKVEVEPGDPLAGHLEPGGPVTRVSLRPSPAILGSPGLWPGLTAFFDQRYHTRSPLRHQIHVGVDGFTVSPADAFDGADDLGVQHGASRTYRAANQWAVTQELAVFGTKDPEDPGAPWPQWLKLDCGANPCSAVPLPCKGCGAPPQVLLSIDGTGLDPVAEDGWIVFSSVDSGEPPYEITRKVRIDHCREVFEDLTLPQQGITLLPGQDHVRSLNVPPTVGTTISDVDVITDLTLDTPASDLPLTVLLQGPEGPPVFLKELPGDPLRDVWDEQTFRGASGNLDNFNNLSSEGSWVLTIHNDDTKPITFDFERFNVRLHHNNAPPCVQ